MGWILIALGAVAAWLVTLAAGMWIGWTARPYEDSRADQPPARDGGGRGDSPDPVPRPPLPFPGQFLLEIEDPDGPGGGDHWYAELTADLPQVRARLEEHLEHGLRVIRGEAPGE